ncbi:MAG: fumarylacetoacetate hydrolase [Novosphingobium sp. 17-62-19]|uniref:fumarylacetoacetate hydrolase family protein n=1 Tax=Novosphingobium sp. 17-62-19 TaxID=1970406 RepID=UPI000BD5888F|nr:fumarylacetoacetate hydrolase family protein [Novosphingobium sp. 17-62-19]OYX91477.1 MAG: fumarylacetoacetate hydrolase [Novosphingobium sp. 35-62-5]OZA21195.1 MAG: fumarylacetoacetate hydrolase [Novosphingobium sp. 17-62-19]HQS96354.1 fumarylacetoacetate hydrolase family protein [Novosphingobium sp.]
MRLATLNDGTRDGRLVLVSPDGAHCAPAPVATLQQAIEEWDVVAQAFAAINHFPEALDPAQVLAPLPRAWQWLDGSAFQSHGDLMDAVLGITKSKTDLPLMYQGMSDTFLAPTADARFPSEELGIDFEGEFGVIVDAVPMGTTAADAMSHIKLIVQINDWSLRTLAGLEMKTGFGWVGAKPACGMAPFAVTPDELGAAWANGRVGLDLLVDWNGERFGAANGAVMGFGFHELVAHAARTRDLVAGTVIGSGTVSNANFREIGSSCIAERRGIEVLDQGELKTAFMAFGDTVRMEAVDASGRAPFGVLDQKVVRA